MSTFTFPFGGEAQWLSDLPDSYHPKWVVESMVLERGLNFLLGAPKVRKSTLRRNLLAAILGGKPFLGFKTRGIRRALVLVGESAIELESTLQHAACVAEGLVQADYGKRIILAKPFGLDLSKMSSAIELASFMRDEGCDFLVVDPLVNFHSRDENDALAMGMVTRSLLSLAENSTVLVVHHAGKPSENDHLRSVGHMARGSSVLGGAADTSLLLTRHPTNGRSRLRFETRHAAEPEPLSLHFDGSRWEVGPETPNVSASELEEKVVALLSSEPSLSANAVHEKVGGSRKTVLEAVKRFHEGGTSTGTTSTPQLNLFPTKEL